ncbi:Ltp family lipoprotein [Rossellomorea marisflavi]|jgi:Host cell surface-exposed lipoprotein|uniref:Ltp family lipoprotein n=1 Tax=Rossellomorea marisflavi TaxID=189381 RepID=UPI00064FE2B4|nr:Ltp family lipoprotein [Rossellomorea marisflavi]KML32315.1 lipoprotein [Rossellomorea marisflavi]KQU57739.1 hypothetical protein ASG66_18540 [Bacillus sp. Leaf406]
MKKFFKFGCLGFIALVVLLIILGLVTAAFSDSKDSTFPDTQVEKKEATKTASENEEKNDTSKKEEKKNTGQKKEDVPREFASALKKAETYANTMSMSKAAIYDQLVSEYGEKFPEEAAQYAMEHIEHDWKANALKKAETYVDEMAMSSDAVYDQLVSEYGEKFTAEEAQYAVEHLK